MLCRGGMSRVFCDRECSVARSKLTVGQGLFWGGCNRPEEDGAGKSLRE